MEASVLVDNTHHENSEKDYESAYRSVQHPS